MGNVLAFPTSFCHHECLKCGQYYKHDADKPHTEHRSCPAPAAKNMNGQPNQKPGGSPP